MKQAAADFIEKNAGLYESCGINGLIAMAIAGANAAACEEVDALERRCEALEAQVKALMQVTR
jgi:hypothetical protein